MLAWTLLGHFESVFKNPVYAASGKHGFLQDQFVFSAFKHPPAHRGIFAFGVFANHYKVDITRLTPCQRACHAGEQPHRANVHVLIKLTAKFEQRAPQRDVIRHFVRPAHGAKEDGVEALELLKPVVRHHLSMTLVIIATGPLKGFNRQVQVPLFGCGLHNAQAFGQYFVTNAVTSDGGNSECLAHGADS